jgi:hypothetical protein
MLQPRLTEDSKCTPLVQEWNGFKLQQVQTGQAPGSLQAFYLKELGPHDYIVMIVVRRACEDAFGIAAMKHVDPASIPDMD